MRCSKATDYKPWKWIGATARERKGAIFKMKTLSDNSSIFEKVAKSAAKGAAEGVKGKSPKPEPVSEITVRCAENGGYIVSYYKPSDDMSMGKRVEKVYEDMAGVGECIESVFGKKKEKKDGGEY